jgi:hypothetical protein
MDFDDLPDAVRAAVARFAEAAAGARILLTNADLDFALPQREYSSGEVEAILSYLAEHGVHLSEEK